MPAADDAFRMELWLDELLNPATGAYAKRFEKAWSAGRLVAHCLRCGDNVVPLPPGIDPQSMQDLKPDLTHHQRWARPLLQHEMQRHLLSDRRREELAKQFGVPPADVTEWAGKVAAERQLGPPRL